MNDGPGQSADFADTPRAAAAKGKWKTPGVGRKKTPQTSSGAPKN